MIGILIVDDKSKCERPYAPNRGAGQCFHCRGGGGWDRGGATRPDTPTRSHRDRCQHGSSGWGRGHTEHPHLLPHTVLVGMSCHSPEMVERALLAAGADAFLPKDTLAQQLLPVVAQILSRRAPSTMLGAKPRDREGVMDDPDHGDAAGGVPFHWPAPDPKEAASSGDPLGRTGGRQRPPTHRSDTGSVMPSFRPPSATGTRRAPLSWNLCRTRPGSSSSMSPGQPGSAQLWI